MFDTKIFQDLKGVYNWCKYNWVKSQHPKKFPKDKENKELWQIDDELLSQYELKAKPDCIKVLTEIMKYLNIQTREEEIEAMYEMMSLNGDREMNFVDIYKIFVKDEKELNKEKEQLEEAFKFLGGDETGGVLEWEKLEQTMKTYDVKYLNLMDDIAKEILESDFAEQEKRNARGEKGKLNFYYEDYLEDAFKPIPK